MIHAGSARASVSDKIHLLSAHLARLSLAQLGSARLGSARLAMACCSARAAGRSTWCRGVGTSALCSCSWHRRCCVHCSRIAAPTTQTIPSFRRHPLRPCRRHHRRRHLRRRTTPTTHSTCCTRLCSSRHHRHRRTSPTIPSLDKTIAQRGT